jgi:sugar phosphate isomerase/epimerase
MDFGLSTHLFVEHRLSSHILDQILGTGLSCIEIFAARQHFDYHDANHIRDVADWFEDHDVKLHSLHAPLYADFDWGRSGRPAVSMTYLEKRQRIDSMEEIKRAIEVAERLPFSYLVLHLGVNNEEYSLAKFDAALTSLEHLKIYAKERGVQVLLENTPNELSTPERLLQFIHYTRLDDLKICFDTGHAHLGGGVRPAFQTLKHRIVCAHIHDNRGEKDDHLLPFEGGINWDQTILDFRAADAQFPLLFELRQQEGEATDLARLREVMERMESVH